MIRRSSTLLAVPVIGKLEKTIAFFDIYRGPNGVIEIQANDKTKLNLMDRDYYFGIMNVMHELNEDPTAKVAIFTSKEGHAFTGGTNLKALSAQFAKQTEAPTPYPAQKLQGQHAAVRRFQDCLSSIARARIPVLAAMDRYCLGGGTSVATACDMRYCTANTIFSVREAAVGMAADVGVLQRLPQIVGQGRARELAYTARDFKGPEAKAINFVEEVYPDYEQMLIAVRKVAEQIAGNSPLAVQGTKMVLNLGREEEAQRSLSYIAAWNAFNIPCDDVVEAKSAFMEKRPPAFNNTLASCSTTVPHPPNFEM